jgi:hypothetical protein
MGRTHGRRPPFAAFYSTLHQHGGLSINGTGKFNVLIPRESSFGKKYALDMDFDSVGTLCGRFGLTFPSL